jgi:DNA adenine methylase
MEQGRDQYYRLREIDISTLDRAQKAARFIYLNRFCFNGLYRTNRSGKFNVPYGAAKAGALPTDALLRRCSQILKYARLVPKSFEHVLQEVREGDFVYMDPPFSVRERRVFNEYNAASFGASDLELLRKWMEKLTEQNIVFVVSYAESEEARVLYSGFYKQTVSVKRNIAGFTAHRVHSNEVLISNRAINI